MAKPAVKVDVSDDPQRFEEAVRAFRDLVPLGDDEFDSLLEGEKAFAFKVAGVAQADLVTQVHDALERAIEDGTTFEDFQEEIGGELAEAWGGADPARLETIFRTNVLKAYNAGRYSVMTAPAMQEARPFWRYDGVEDDATCEDCEPLNGVIRPADDPFWDGHNPPLHHRCRDMITPLSEEEAEELGLTEKLPKVDVAEGFGDAPDDDGQDWSPDPDDYPPAIGDILRGRLR